MGFEFSRDLGGTFFLARILYFQNYSQVSLSEYVFPIALASVILKVYYILNFGQNLAELRRSLLY